MDDMEDIITSSIEDAETDLSEDTAPETPVETPTEPVEATPETPVVESPAEKVAAPTATDDFEKKFGIAPTSSSGRENRIPYTRVKKISEKAVNDAKASWTKDLEKSYTPVAKYQEAETKIKDYESRLGQVAEFEKIMTTDHNRFLTMLAGLPGYREIFEQLAGSATRAQPTPEAPVPQAVDDLSTQPQPDQELSDGSKVYTMDGLNKLNAWNRALARKEVMAEVETRMKAIENQYAPLKKDYDSYQAVQAVIPKVNAQIAEARTWPQFNENEEAIVKSLQANPTFSLERAYQAVVMPKFQADQERLTSSAQVNRDTLRAEILQELKAAPRATSTLSSATKAVNTPPGAGPRALEDVISDSLKALR